MSKDKLVEIKNELDNNLRHKAENLLSIDSIEWLIEEIEMLRTKRGQCEDTIATLLAECKRQNAEIQELRKIKDAATEWHDSLEAEGEFGQYCVAVTALKTAVRANSRSEGAE